MLTWSQFRKKRALGRERNKVEVLEGKFRSLNFSLSPKRKQTFTCYTSNQNCHTYMCTCVRALFWMRIKKSTLTKKKDSVPTSWAPCTTLLQSVPYQHAGFAEWEQKPQITGLRMIFVGQTTGGPSVIWEFVWEIKSLYGKWNLMK